jgi:hypothetical protein
MAKTFKPLVGEDLSPKKHPRGTTIVTALRESATTDLTQYTVAAWILKGAEPLVRLQFSSGHYRWCRLDMFNANNTVVASIPPKKD